MARHFWYFDRSMARSTSSPRSKRKRLRECADRKNSGTLDRCGNRCGTLNQLRNRIWRNAPDFRAPIAPTNLTLGQMEIHISLMNTAISFTHTIQIMQTWIVVSEMTFHSYAWTAVNNLSWTRMRHSNAAQHASTVRQFALQTFPAKRAGNVVRGHSWSMLTFIAYPERRS